MIGLVIIYVLSRPRHQSMTCEKSVAPVSLMIGLSVSLLLQNSKCAY